MSRMTDPLSKTDDPLIGKSDAKLSSRALAVGVITMARFIGHSDPALSGYLRESLRHAEQSGLGPDDLVFLKLLNPCRQMT